MRCRALTCGERLRQTVWPAWAQPSTRSRSSECGRLRCGGHQLGGADGQSRGRRGARAQDPRHPTRRDALRADAPEVRHRSRRNARQNDHHFDDCCGDERGWRRGQLAPDGGGGRTRGRTGLQCAPGQLAVPGGRGRRERPLIPEAISRAGRRHQPRPRAHGLLSRYCRCGERVRRVYGSRAVLWRDHGLRGQCPSAWCAAARPPPCLHLRRIGRRGFPVAGTPAGGCTEQSAGKLWALAVRGELPRTCAGASSPCTFPAGTMY